MRVNDLPEGIPDDAELHVDVHAGTITVEVFATDADGRPMIHARRQMTRVETFPLKAPPPPGLLDAYEYTVARLRRERSVVDQLRADTIREVCMHLYRRGREVGETNPGLGGFLLGVSRQVWKELGAGPPPIDAEDMAAGSHCGGGCPT